MTPHGTLARRPLRGAGRCGTDTGRVATTGFTLVEMLVVISILGVMLGMLAPSFNEFLAAQRAKGLSYDLLADLALARNEALKRNATVTITRGGSSWSAGWNVTAAGAAAPLSRRNVVGSSVTVTNAPAAIQFDVNGRVLQPLTAVRMTISSAAASRCVELDPSGRARALTGACT